MSLCVHIALLGFGTQGASALSAWIIYDQYGSHGKSGVRAFCVCVCAYTLSFGKHRCNIYAYVLGIHFPPGPLSACCVFEVCVCAGLPVSVFFLLPRLLLLCV